MKNSKATGPTINIMPVFIELIIQLKQLQSKINFWHGDIKVRYFHEISWILKPENMIICKRDDGTPYIRLIDPVSRKPSVPFSRIVSLTYNPKG